MLLALAALSFADDTVLIRDIRASDDWSSEGVAWSPDGRRAAAAVLPPGADGRVVVWDAETGKPLASFPFQGDAPRVGFSADGSRLAVWQLYTPGDSVDGNTLSVFDVGSGERVWSAPGSASALGLSRDGGSLADAEGWTQVKVRALLDPGEGRAHDVARFDKEAYPTLWAVALSADGGRVAMLSSEGGEGKTLRVSSGGAPLDVPLAIEGSCYAAEFSPDGSAIAIGCGDGAVYLLTGAEFGTIRTLKLAKDTHVRPVFSPDGRTIAVGAQGGGKRKGPPATAVGFYSADTGDLLRTWAIERCTIATRYARFTGTEGPEANPARFAWSPDGASILVGCAAPAVLDAKTGEIVRQFQPGP